MEPGTKKSKSNNPKGWRIRELEKKQILKRMAKKKYTAGKSGNKFQEGIYFPI